MERAKELEYLIQMFELIDDHKEPRDVVLICRNVLEKAIDIIFSYTNTNKIKNASLLELVNNETVQRFFDSDVMIDSLHFIRIVGINALHGKNIKKSQAQISYTNTKFLIETLISKLKLNNGCSSEGTETVSDKSNSYNSTLNEAETRKVYIDLYLNEAGWEVVKPQGKTALADGKTVTSGSVIPSKACCEIPVKGLKNVSGIGFCDYVLYGRDGKPLAIVEAKKTSVDAIVGQQQVREYGRCMAEQYGYMPVLYYTNGYDIFVIDGKYPSRKVRSFHTLDELSNLIYIRENSAISDLKVNTSIAGRPYQIRAITSICERFNDMQRRGLLVMATGTGKTRTAIALVDVLMRNKWIKNVLFLADRTSLVNQAFRNFHKLLPNESYCVLSDKALSDDPNARITFSTHQTMINKIDKEEKEFTIGRFDLIIIDEAHRSIFNKYGAIFDYFDSLLIGLTATPKDEVDSNTYSIFNCESGEPNFAYSLKEAVADGYLVPYRLVSRKTKILTEGISYKDLSDEEKATLQLMTEEEFDDDSYISKSALFKKIYNKDTCRKVLDDLMNIGIKINQGQLIGKTIIFAINHIHAEMIVDTFNEMYPKYHNYCKLIDNRIKNANHLIEEFGSDPEFRIAVSVDMLDTGVDVPEVLNLVFFKKINSHIKLVQMIGRGTRLCEGLLDGKDKQGFFIFDYFDNFKGQESEEIKTSLTIAQKLFIIRTEMMCAMQSSAHQTISEQKAYYLELKDMLFNIVKDIKKYGSNKIGVRENMNVVDKYCDLKEWQYLSSLDEKEVTYVLSPLVESDTKENYLSLAFDYKMLKIERELIKGNDINSVRSIVKNIRKVIQVLLEKASITEIADKLDILNEMYSGNFWNDDSISNMEYGRKEIRNLMKYVDDKNRYYMVVDTNDVIVDGSFDIDSSFDIRTYKEKVIDYLLENNDNKTITKIKNLEPLDNDDFKYLEYVLWVKLGKEEDYKKIANSDNLAIFVRSLVGIEQRAINDKFSMYLNNNTLNSDQQEFVYSIINYVQENGDIELNDIIEESPFSDYNIQELFGNNIPIVRTVVERLHNCIEK